MSGGAHKSLAEALAAAQATMPAAPFDRENPHFRSRYASMASVTATLRQHASPHGLSWRQSIEPRDDGTIVCRTTIAWGAETWESLSAGFIPVKRDPQGVASAVTYARRIGLATAFGLSAAEDDDGNAASRGDAGGKPAGGCLSGAAYDSHCAAIDAATTRDALVAARNAAMRACADAGDADARAALDARARARKEAIRA